MDFMDNIIILLIISGYIIFPIANFLDLIFSIKKIKKENKSIVGEIKWSSYIIIAFIYLGICLVWGAIGLFVGALSTDEPGNGTIYQEISSMTFSSVVLFYTVFLIVCIFFRDKQEKL